MENTPVPQFKRCQDNPIITPGKFSWRMAAVFNPGVFYENDTFYLYERAAGGLRPFSCHIGMLKSFDGVQFEHVLDKPVYTPAMAGSRFGSVQDPRLVKIENSYYMTYAFRPYAWNSYPTGLGVPESHEAQFPGFSGNSLDNLTRSGVAVSRDKITWEHYEWVTPPDVDDRDVILFPEKIDGNFVLLHRPLQFVSPDHTVIQSTGDPAIRIRFSTDLKNWSESRLLIKPEFPWEGGRIGGATPPVKTKKGWLLFYHGVETLEPLTKRVCYRLGAVLLDLNDPTKVILRPGQFIMEPEYYYEKFGLYIPNVIFPTGCVLKDGLIYLYYGVCDTAIGMATVELDRLLEWMYSTGNVNF
ncbi:glycosidase [candidate division KSB1 bacterium]|nr:glycosidase [candidate division KSB1 bacterium]